MIRIIKEHDKKAEPDTDRLQDCPGRYEFLAGVGHPMGDTSSQTSRALGNKEVLISGGRYRDKRFGYRDDSRNRPSTCLGFRPGGQCNTV